MKVALFLIIAGVSLTSWLVGHYATDPSSTSAGPAAGFAVFGGGMTITGWIRMVLEQRK